MFRRSTLALLTACLSILLLCQISSAAPGDDENAPRHRPPRGGPDRQQMNDDGPDLAQLQQQIRQLSLQVARLQQTLDARDRQPQTADRQKFRQSGPRDQQGGSWSRSRQRRGEFHPQRMMRRPGMMGQRGMMQRRGNGRRTMNRSARMYRRGPMRPMDRGNFMPQGREQRSFGGPFNRQGFGESPARGGGPGRPNFMNRRNFMGGPGMRGPQSDMNRWSPRDRRNMDDGRGGKDQRPMMPHGRWQDGRSWRDGAN